MLFGDLLGALSVAVRLGSCFVPSGFRFVQPCRGRLLLKVSTPLRPVLLSCPSGRQPMHSTSITLSLPQEQKQGTTSDTIEH